MVSWRVEAWRLVGVLGASLLLGWALGQPGWTVALGLAALLAWQWANLYRLGRWAAGQEKSDPPEMTGAWGDLMYAVLAHSNSQQGRLGEVGAELERIRGFLFSFPDAVIELNAENHILWLNRQAQSFFGLRMDKDLGRRIDLLLTHRALTRFLDGEDNRAVLEMPAPGDPEKILAVHISPTAQGRRLVVARDVTRVQRLETTRRDFVADASHELRTPLTVVSGYLELMNQDTGENLAGWSKQLGAMTQQVARMNNLIGDLLTLSRLETSPEAGTTKEVRLAGILEGIVREARELSGDKAHAISLETDAALDLLGNSREIYSAISNLVFNAVTYTPPEKKIAIRWCRDHGGGCLEVEDQGIGIEAVHLPRLTERFYRVDTSRSRASGGTGLGLAIVKHVLNRHNAQLVIESSFGKGSTFICRFPPHRVVSHGPR